MKSYNFTHRGEDGGVQVIRTYKRGHWPLQWNHTNLHTGETSAERQSYKFTNPGIGPCKEIIHMYTLGRSRWSANHTDLRTLAQAAAMRSRKLTHWGEVGGVPIVCAFRRWVFSKAVGLCSPFSGEGLMQKNNQTHRKNKSMPIVCAFHRVVFFKAVGFCSPLSGGGLMGNQSNTP